MPDPQDVAESLDDDNIDPDFPPDTPMGVDEYGTTAGEERVPEPLARSVVREEDDRITADEPLVQPIVDEAIVDTEEDAVADAVIVDDEEADPNVLAGEGVAPPAEEAAIHVVPEPEEK